MLAGAQIWLQLQEQLQSEMLVQVFVYNLCTSWMAATCEVRGSVVVTLELLLGLTMSCKADFS